MGEVIMGKIGKFPVVKDINAFRSDLFKKSHNMGYYERHPQSMAVRTSCWLLHKAVSVISLPANAVAIGVGCAGMVATASTLGALKIAVHTLSLGNFELKFPIGFVWLGERTVISLSQTFDNIGELTFDYVELLCEGYRGVRFVLTALKMGHLMKYVNRALDFAGQRIEKGVAVSMQDEQALPVAKLPTVLQELQGATTIRSCFNDKQDFVMAIEHMVLSAVNIPLQATVAAASGVLCTAGFTASAAKAALYAATNIHVGIPTGVSYTGRVCLLSGINAAMTGVELAAGTAVSIYRVVDALHIVKALITVRDVIAYIPRAIFS